MHGAATRVGAAVLSMLLAALLGARALAASGAESVTLRVGLATDLEVVELCCDQRVTFVLDGQTRTLGAALRIEPAAALRGTATYRLQVAALKDEGQAHGLAAYLRRETREPSDAVFDADRDLYRVRFGRFAQPEQAEAAKGRLAALGLDQGWVVSEGGMLESPSLRIAQAGVRHSVAGRWLSVDAPAGVGVPFRRARYRTRLLIYLNDRGRLNVINELDVEDYLRGVVPREMGPELYDEIEALKAQAVAARTFTLRNLGEFEREGYDICSTPRCQVYGGMGSEHPLSDRAIDATAGQVVLVDGAPAETFYSATCGGHTENVEVVFPLKRGRHLRGVPCIEAGERSLSGAGRPGARGEPFPRGLTRALLPPAPGQPAQVLSARLEHLALLAGLRVPRDRLASVERDEVRRYLLSVLDLVLDPRLLAAPEQLTALASTPPAGWREDERKLASYFRQSGVLAPGSGSLAEGQVDELLFQLALYLGVLDEQPASYLEHDGDRLAVRRDGAVESLILEPAFATYRRSGERLLGGPLTLMPGDPLVLYRHRDRLLAAVQARELPAVDFGGRNAQGRWRLRRSRAALRASVQARYPGFPYQNFQVLSRGVSGRVGSMRLLGSDGRSLLVDGLAVRWTLDLPDTWFEAEPASDGGYLFTGHGWGHGVGLCQAGVYGMAVRGADYREILRHYYTGVQLGRLRGVEAPDGAVAGAHP